MSVADTSQETPTSVSRARARLTVGQKFFETGRRARARLTLVGVS